MVAEIFLRQTSLIKGWHFCMNLSVDFLFMVNL